MMRLFVFFTGIMFFFCCQNKPSSPKDRAILSVSDYIKKNLDDPISYEPGEFSVDSNKIMYRLTAAGRKKIMEYESMWIYLSQDLYPNINQDSVETEMRKLDSLLSAPVYDPDKPGWYVSHDYRAKNINGAKQLYRQGFVLDTNFQVLRREDLKLVLSNER